jgi:hypothetical protein
LPKLDEEKFMQEFNFKAQSYKWSSFSVVVEDDVPSSVLLGDWCFRNVRLSEIKAGNMTRYILSPSGKWHAVQVAYSGEISVSKHSTGKAILALASSGSWSGGGNYKGFVFGQTGAVILFNRKGSKKWLVFGEDGPQWEFVPPNTTPKELV